MGDSFFTQCQDQPEAGGRAVPDGCECGVHVRYAMLVKYLHGHEFLNLSGFAPLGNLSRTNHADGKK